MRQLKARGGHDIVAISRTPEAAADADEARPGDYDRPETLAAAYEGLDRLLVIPTSDLRPGRRAIQNVAAIDAAVEAGVGHVVFLTEIMELMVWAKASNAKSSIEPTSPERRMHRRCASWMRILCAVDGNTIISCSKSP
ncbi:NAD(P)H-binding protein [Neoaquamicrobium microcysteis]|uniref:NAD(P)H-binding protein n=1 Tax=Neoaquamicrobium microcysteis TaxID=2682781 RepID=UPI001F1F5E0A|nr:NAD(P)H-binding protein [Mesorhizobium microcysteis]